MSGPAGWCTNWTAYDTPAIWQMVAGEDDPQGWRQVNAWGNFEQAVGAQRRRLLACRQALVEKWPPESSEASQAFVARLDDLIANMDASLAAAASTASGLAGIMQALANAKRELEPIKKEYDGKSTDLILRSWDDAEDELNEKARQIIAKAELAVRDYTPMIKSPPQYQVLTGSDTITPFDPNEPGPKGDDRTISTVPPVPHDPPVHREGQDPVTADGRDWRPATPGGGGPGLAGTIPPGGLQALPGQPGPIAVGPGVAGPAAAGPGGGGTVPPGLGPALPPGGVIGAGGLPGGVASGRGAGRAGPLRAAGRGVPPGGVIGGAAPGGPGPAPGGGGRRGGAGRGGTGRGGKAGAGGARSGAAPHPGGRTRRGEGTREVGHAGDPDNQWETDEGVPPVIGPAGGESKPDPGPGVIGMDR